MQYLVEPFPHSTLLQIRVIWRWVTDNIVYDVESYFAPGMKKYGRSEAGEVLTSGKAVCSGYANVMKTLAEYVGITLFLLLAKTPSLTPFLSEYILQNAM